MAITICTGGFQQMLIDYLAAETTITCHLFDNNYTPANTDTTGNYSEASFTGYASVITSSWSTPSNAAPSVTSAANCTFTSSADQTPVLIYGAYLTDHSGNLIGAELFSSPITIQNNGDQIVIVPTLTMGQC